MLSLVWIFIVTVPAVRSGAPNNEALLLGTLLENYTQPTARPVLNDSEAVVVTYRYIVTQVIDLDERRQFITVNGWMAMTWQDQLMVWNASEYDGVDTIKVSKKSIWTPDITLYNNVDTGFERVKNTVPLSITSDGTVSMATPAIYTAFCKMDVKYFPFDKQVCYFKHGSWAYGSHHVDVEALQGEEANQDYFNENGIWGLDFVSFKKNILKYDCCPHPFTDVTMTIGLSRRSEFYVGNVLAPCVLLSFLAAFVFFLPPECGEKISFSITNLLAIVLFQQLIAESLPPSDETPYIASFFTLIISLGCFSVVATSIILKFHFGQHIKPVNKFIHKVFIRGLGSILGVYKDLDSDVPPPCFKRVDLVSPCPVINEDKNKTNGSLSPAIQASSEFKDVMADIRKFNQHIEERKKEEELTKTWTDLASVIDRVMLILCMLIVLCASVIIMIKLIYK